MTGHQRGGEPEAHGRPYRPAGHKRKKNPPRARGGWEEGEVRRAGGESPAGYLSRPRQRSRSATGRQRGSGGWSRLHRVVKQSSRRQPSRGRPTRTSPRGFRPAETSSRPAPFGAICLSLGGWLSWIMRLACQERTTHSAGHRKSMIARGFKSAGVVSEIGTRTRGIAIITRSSSPDVKTRATCDRRIEDCQGWGCGLTAAPGFLLQSAPRRCLRTPRRNPTTGSGGRARP